MSVEDKNIDEKLVAAVTEEVPVSALDEVLKERDTKKPEEDSRDEPIKPVEKEKLTLKTQKTSKIADKEDESKEDLKNPENKAADKKVIESKDDDGDDRDVELGKLRKALNDSQKWGHTNNKRLKSVVKIVSSLKESGVLTDDEFSNLNTYLTSDVEEPDIEEQQISKSPLDRFINSASKRLGDLREVFDEDPLFDKKVEAFDFFVKHATEQERDELAEELEDFDPNSLKLAKRLFQIGEKYYEENYKELDEAGGLKELVSIKNTELKRMQRKIDKLEKELSQYNDFDKPNLRIDELGDTLTENASTDEPGNVLGSILKERDSRRR